jgi:gliding motility-associated-like protein
VLSKISTDANCGNSDGSATVSIQSGGTGPFSFSWNTNPVQTTTSVTGLVAGSYICTVTDANNCTQTSDVTIGNIGGGVASISSSTQVSCFGGNDGSATALITGGNGPFSYAWNTTFVQITATATGLIAGSYTCTITATNGCIATASVTISQPDPIDAVSSTLPSACGATNGSATVTINSTPIQTTATANNLAAGSYICTITDANSCTQLTNAIVDSDGGGTASISGSIDILCFGLSTGSSTATITGGQPPYTYSWNTTPVQNTQTATGLPAGIYNCTISDANGCVKTVTDTLVQPVAITSQASSIAACGINNGSATALVQGGNLPYSYNWSPSGGNTSTATGLPNGLYICTITDANGCIDTCSVNVISKPSPTAYAGEDVTIRIGSDTLLVGSGGGSYSWFPYETLSCDNCQSPVATPTSTTTYILTVTSSNGCSSVDSVTVFVDIKCGEVFVPNAFSPNNDTENDLECVFGNCFKTFQFSIYDRWGEKVFESSSQKLCWDGTFKGSPMNTGVFVYVLEADLVTGEQVRKKGEINLIR